jgi:ABC-type sugar transport system ATPase subunit
MDHDRAQATDAPTQIAPVMTLTGIEKSYGPVHVLKGVDLTLRRGEVHALLGENGAGKSTLMKIIFGIEQPDAGAIELDFLGRIKIDSPRAALALGIGLVSQELSLVPQLDVAQNIFLGKTDATRFVPRKHYRLEAAKILAELAPHIRVDSRVEALGMADRQLVEISRTLARGGRIIAFDEPTSSLTPAERDNLFRVIARLKEAGKVIVYISHRMKEIREICDSVTVLRDGCVIVSGNIGRYSEDELNNLIAGRQLSEEIAARPISAVQLDGPVSLEVKGLTSERIRDVDFRLQQGEIFGFAGLVGSGRSAIMRALFGMDAITGGEIHVDGKPVAIDKPVAAIRAGIALIPEDRRGHAIVPMMDIEQNFGLANYHHFTRGGFILGRKRKAEIRRMAADMHIRPDNIATQLRNLSGGNQQKVVIARWLATGARIFLFDEPTRGIDVGAKSEIYALLRNLAAAGATVLVVSSELPELLMLCNRIGVVVAGQMVRTLSNDGRLNEEVLMKYAALENVS